MRFRRTLNSYHTDKTNMASHTYALLLFAFLAAWSPQVRSDDCGSCPGTFDPYDYIYCCSDGSCCDAYDYVSGLSTGAIVGIAIGSILFVALIIGSIVACCVCCCAAAAPRPAPVHVHTIAVPPQQSGTVVTVDNPPGYYAPAQPAPKPGQYQKF